MNEQNEEDRKEKRHALIKFIAGILFVVVLILGGRGLMMVGAYQGCDYGEVIHLGPLNPQCLSIDYDFAYCEDIIGDTDLYLELNNDTMSMIPQYGVQE